MFDPKVHVGVGALLTKYIDGEEHILLLHRGWKSTHGRDTWALPGGWIDWGQSAQEAAARELLEEVNVTVDDPGMIIGSVSNTYEDQDMHVICILVAFYVWDDREMENMERDKHNDVMWVPVADLGAYRLFPALESYARLVGWI